MTRKTKTWQVEPANFSAESPAISPSLSWLCPAATMVLGLGRLGLSMA
jgi:hypothetical protein